MGGRTRTSLNDEIDGVVEVVVADKPDTEVAHLMPVIPLLLQLLLMVVPWWEIGELKKQFLLRRVVPWRRVNATEEAAKVG